MYFSVTDLLSVCTYVFISVYTCLRVYVRTYVCVYVPMYVCLRVYVCVFFTVTITPVYIVIILNGNRHDITCAMSV